MTVEKLGQEQIVRKERITRTLLVVGFVSIFCGMNTLDKGGIIAGVIFSLIGIVAILCATKILRRLE